MAANTSTVLRKYPERASVRAMGRVVRDAGAGLAAWWNQLAARGQLGQDHERELGRHTGARI